MNNLKSFFLMFSNFGQFLFSHVNAPHIKYYYGLINVRSTKMILRSRVMQ